LPEVIAAVRAELVENKLAPQVVYDLEETFKEWGNPYKRQSPSPAEGSGDLALFVGDEAQYLWPGAVDAALELLAALGLRPVLLGAGRNSGYIASSLGLHAVAKKLAENTLAELETAGAKRLLVLSPGDFFTFNQLYEERLGMPWPEGVELQELTVLLAESQASGSLNFKQAKDENAFAYVDPTLAVRVPSRHQAPRALLAAVGPAVGRELLWRKERAHPVGSTALQFTRPDIAEKLTRARLQDARQTGAKTLISDDPGTLHKLAQLADQYDLRVEGLYEFLAQHLA
jgi:Fe-S oxidoreductase